MGSPTVRLFGTLENIVTPAAGNAAVVTGAQVRVELSNYGPYIPSEVGTARGILAKGDSYASTTAPGQFEAYLFRNDQIYPIGTFYTIIVEDADGNVIQCAAYRFNEDGDFDLAEQTPIDAQNPPPPLPPTPPYGELLVIPYTPSIVIDGANYTAFEVTLIGDTVIEETVNIMPGNLYTITFVQDGVGDHAVTWADTFFNWTDVCPDPNSRSTQTFVADENLSLFAVSASTWYIG
jgi:hypothetical protein